MRICKIWDADYPWDIRVEKISNSLAMAGHEVHLVCRNEARRQKTEWNGRFTIHRLPVFPDFADPIKTLWNFPFAFNPIWIHSIAQVVRDTQADLILVRDILLALPAVILGRFFQIPVILDMAENYPAMLRDRIRYTPTGRLAALIRHPSNALVVECVALKFVDHVIVVVEESRERLVHKGVPWERISVVGNTPKLDQWLQVERALQRVTPQREMNLVYLGNLDGSRGVDVAIRAVEFLKRIGRLVRLSIIGDGPCIQELRNLASKLSVEDRVLITGRLPWARIEAIMAKAHVGIIPHYVTDAWNSTIPNKLFDYMCMGLPVIVSDAKPTARIVQAERCGEVFRDRNPEDLARCVLLLENPELCKREGCAGKVAVRERYNWERDSQVLVKVVQNARRSGSRLTQ